MTALPENIAQACEVVADQVQYRAISAGVKSHNNRLQILIGQQKMITNIKLKPKGVVRYPSYLVFETFFNQLSIDFKCFKYTNPGFVLSTIFQKKKRLGYSLSNSRCTGNFEKSD